MTEQERLLRRNFTFDATGALGTGLFNALVVNFPVNAPTRQRANAVGTRFA